MLAQLIRQYGSKLSEMDVVELDPRSPLRPILSEAKSYVRSYYSPTDSLGSLNPDGARCESITRLTFTDNSVDLIVSSDVLEHVPDLVVAFKETARVLRPGGIHLFTVPPRDRTRRRAEFIDGKLKHSAEPEYHSDPLNLSGILTFWDIGPDAPHYFSLPDLELSIVRGPEGKDRRVVWKAQKKPAIVPDRNEN
ncbi:MAG: class I SAM-dependent methyltransferase [Gallionella sp.]